MRISDWGSDVCSSDLPLAEQRLGDCLVARRGGLVRPDALDLGFEQRDSFVEFVHRQRIEWLADLRRENVALAEGKVDKIGRKHVRTAVTNAQLACRFSLETKNTEVTPAN